MILDDLTMFCEKQAVTTDAASSNKGSYGTGYIDLGPTDQFETGTNTGTELFGVGEPVNIEALVTTDMDDGASPSPAATVAVTLETADDSSFTSNKATILTLGTFSAGAKKGTRLVSRLPLGAEYRRYIRVYFTITSGPLTGGKFSAYLCKDSQLGQMYPSRTPIS